MKQLICNFFNTGYRVSFYLWRIKYIRCKAAKYYAQDCRFIIFFRFNQLNHFQAKILDLGLVSFLFSSEQVTARWSGSEKSFVLNMDSMNTYFKGNI